jgi:hypothetical protein
LRPVSRAARLGEQSAVVWKRVYGGPLGQAIEVRRRNLSAERAPLAEPASSIRMISTFGAPAGALVRAIVPGFESL